LLLPLFVVLFAFLLSFPQLVGLNFVLALFLFLNLYSIFTRQTRLGLFPSIYFACMVCCSVFYLCAMFCVTSGLSHSLAISLLYTFVLCYFSDLNMLCRFEFYFH
jgi:hypothetical protein